MNYRVKYIHKVDGKPYWPGNPVTLVPADLENSKTLAAALRRQGALMGGGRVRTYHKDVNGHVTAFPAVPGLTTYWHAIILEPCQ